MWLEAISMPTGCSGHQKKVRCAMISPAISKAPAPHQTIRQKLGPPFCRDAVRIHSQGMRGKLPKNQPSMFTPPWR